MKKKELKQEVKYLRVKLSQAIDILEAVERGDPDAAERLNKFMETVRFHRLLFKAMAKFGTTITDRGTSEAETRTASGPETGAHEHPSC